MVAIPAIANDLQADAVLVSWIPTAFLLTTVVLMLPFGKLSDMYGRKRTFLRGMVIMCIASALAALSRDIYWLLGCRILQGIAAAQTMGTAMAIVTSIFPKEKRGAPRFSLGKIEVTIAIAVPIVWAAAMPCNMRQPNSQ